MQALITPPTVSADAKPAKQVLDLDRNTRVTYKPGKRHITIYSEEGAIRVLLSEITQIAEFIQAHKPQA